MHIVDTRSIATGIALTCIKTDKHKTGCLSVNMINGLKRDTAALSALLPNVLRRGSSEHPDMASLSAVLDELYGTRIEPIVRKKGELQSVGFYVDFPDARFLPDGDDILEKTFALLGGVLLSPDMPDGMLRPDYVESEKSNLIDDIRATINDKRTYSVDRLLKEMCSEEAFGIGRLGDEKDVSEITPELLTAHFEAVISNSRMEILYCGSAEPDRVESALRPAFDRLPLRNAPIPITQVVYYPQTGAPKRVTESLDISQGKLAIGFRLGKAMKGIPDFPAFIVLNAIYGGCATSKLFLNVREKLSLCYYASSVIDRNKGVMIVASGVDFANFDTALSEILTQLDSIKKGDIEEWELLSAKRAATTSIKAAMDRTGGLEELYFSSVVSAFKYDPKNLCNMIEAVNMDRIVEAASEITPDTIFFLDQASV